MSRELEVTPSWGRRLVGMEGLRGLAATTVIIGHVRVHLGKDVDYGTLVNKAIDFTGNGLTLFFALSGFLLYRPFANAILTNGNWPRIGRYAKNRALRVFPGYVVILLLVSLVFGVAYTSTLPRGVDVEGAGQTVGFLTDPFKLILNALMVQTFIPDEIKTGIGPAWSLTVELVFYAAMPLLALSAFRFVHRVGGVCNRALVACAPAAILFVVGVAGSVAQDAFLNSQPEGNRFYLEWGGNWHAVFGRSFLAHADLFAFGMLAAVLLVMVERGHISGSRVGHLRTASLIVIPIGVLFGLVMPIQETWYSMAFGAVILYVALPTPKLQVGVAANALETLPFRFTGLISYSMYLWHVPVIWMVVKWDIAFNETGAGFIGNVALVFAITYVLSGITYFACEKPAMQFRKRTDRGADARSVAESGDIGRATDAGP